MSASYPGAAKVFTTRSAGQTIASAIINDLQDEVNAVEAGLLNGSAPVVCSNASVNNLNVAGASTFAGAVTFAGNVSVPAAFQSSNSTVLGTLQVNGAVTFSSAAQLRGALLVPQQLLTLSGVSTTFNDIAVASSAVWVALDGNSTAIIVTGITGSAGIHGRVLFLANTNVSGQGLTLVNQSVGSSVGGRFVLQGGVNKTLPNFTMVTAIFSTVALGGNANIWVIQST